MDILERLRMAMRGYGFCLTLFSDSADEIARLRAELEAARVDAERYRFIKQNVRKRYGVWWINRISAVTGPTDFEVVVDSAMGGK